MTTVEAAFSPIAPSASACSSELLGESPDTGCKSPTGEWTHPPSFYCPISQQCMHDPVVLSDGHSYERRHIERWLKEHSTSPVSNEALSQAAVFPNHALRNAIEEYFEQVFSVHRRAIRRTIRGPDTLPSNFSSHEPLLHTIDALMQCSYLMNAELSTEEVLRQIMREAKNLLGAEVASVFLVDADKQELYSNVNSTTQQLRVPMSRGIAGHVATTGESLIVNDVYADKRFNRTNDLKTGFRTRNMMCVPLIGKNGRVLGVVQLINKTDTGVFSRQQPSLLAARHVEDTSSSWIFTAEDLQFFQVFAAQAATTVIHGCGDIAGKPTAEPVPECTDSETEYGICDAVKCCLKTDPSKEELKSHSSAADSAESNKATCRGQVSTEAKSSKADVPASSHADEKFPVADHSIETSQKQARCLELVQFLDDAFNNWQIDTFALARLTDNKPLSTLGMYLFGRLELVKQFDLNMEKLEAFLLEIERGYTDANPYHNSAHAASVLHAMHALLQHGGIVQEEVDAEVGSEGKVGQMERLACLLAAVVHDFEHLGVSNDFLVRSGDKRAMLYNDKHVNEHHHVAAALAVLAQPQYNFLTNLPDADWRRMRHLMIELVLATDMANGAALLKSFNETFGVNSDGAAASSVPSSQKDMVLLLQMAMKCADLGHLALDWDTHLQWVLCLEEEFFAQGDREKEHAHPVSFLMDRTKPGCSQTQTGFFKFVVLPLFKSLVAVMPLAHPVLDTVINNFRRWEALEASESPEKADETKQQSAAKTEEANEPAGGEVNTVEEKLPIRIPLEAFSSSMSRGSAMDSDVSRASSKCSVSQDLSQSEGKRSPKRSGRTRQRRAKWWASVRKRTPSPGM